jgi:hypothetical protein
MTYINMNLHCGTSQWQKNNDAKHAQANTQGTHTKDIETDNIKEQLKMYQPTLMTLDLK